MKLRTSLMWGIFAAALTLPAAALGQAIDKSDVHNLRPTAPSAASPGRPGEKANSDSGSITYPMPQITVMAPPQPQPQWPLHDRISWAANLVLAFLGYVAIWLALSTLKKIQRQTREVEDAVSVAASTARTALLHVEALVRAERPWIMITAEPSPNTPNGSIVVATNRGRSPARIVAMADQTLSAVGEAQLPSLVDVEIEKRGVAVHPIILLPGESTAIRSFGREDVERLCATEEVLKRVENWDEKVFIVGKVAYKDLNTPADDQIHETSWACWYIYGQKKSGLVTIELPGRIVLT